MSKMKRFILALAAGFVGFALIFAALTLAGFAGWWVFDNLPGAKFYYVDGIGVGDIIKLFCVLGGFWFGLVEGLFIFSDVMGDGNDR